VVYYSPLQFLFWYDQPKQFKWEQELDFWKELPTTWDETRVIQGSIGDYITVARRKGRNWFVGSMNAGERRQLEIPLTFLSEWTDYTATIHSDERPEGDAPKKVRNETKTVTNADTLIADMAANGGHAVLIQPLE
jgi:alpha-glucosidase